MKEKVLVLFIKVYIGFSYSLSMFFISSILMVYTATYNEKNSTIDLTVTAYYWLIAAFIIAMLYVISDEILDYIDQKRAQQRVQADGANAPDKPKEQGLM